MIASTAVKECAPLGTLVAMLSAACGTSVDLQTPRKRRRIYLLFTLMFLEIYAKSYVREDGENLGSLRHFEVCYRQSKD